MYRTSSIKGYKPDLLSHQLYFIQRWSELLESTQLSYRRILKPSLRHVLSEALDTIESFKNQVLYESNIFEILDELVNVLKTNIILKSRFLDDWNLMECEITNFISNKKSFIEIKETLVKYKHLDTSFILIKALLNKLEGIDIIKLYTSYIRGELEKNILSFDSVDTLTELLISELVYEGHNKQYLYKWGQGVFVADKEPYFSRRVDRIADLGSKNKRNFDCLIPMILPDGYEELFEENEDNITFYNKNEDLRVKLAETYDIDLEDKEIVKFFKTEKHIARIKTKAPDEITAINKARHELTSTTKLFTLESRHKLYNPGNFTEAIIFDVDGKSISVNPSIDNYKHGLQIGKSIDYIKINLSARLTNKYQGLNQILQWCRVIQDSPHETGLVAMWSLLEFLFVLDNTNKKENVIEYTIPYICSFYFRNITYRVRELLMEHPDKKSRLNDEIRNKLGTGAIDTIKQEPKLHYFIQFLAEEKANVISIYDNEIIEQRYIGLLNKYMQIRGEKLWGYEYIEKLEKEIRSNLERCYRIRNILAHNACIDESFMEETYDIVAYYIKLILDDLLYSMTQQPYNSAHDLVKIKWQSYNQYIGLFKNIKASDKIQYKKIVSARSLLI